MAYYMGNYYAQNTDVWVFATRQQYRIFRDLLLAGKDPTKVIADEGRGMDLLILPPAKAAAKDFIVIHERLVHQGGRFNMELIIGGSQAGISVVADYFGRAAGGLAPDIGDHLHLADGEEMLILPAVFLSIRGPVEDIDKRLRQIAPPAPEDLPPDADDWRDPKLWPYESITYEAMHGRLPLSKH